MAWICSATVVNRKITEVYVTPKFDSRFQNDKVYIEKENRRVLIDGVILNKSELEEENGKEFREIVSTQGLDSTFPRCLRGPFTGMFYDGKQICAYGNQTGDACVFYYVDKQLILISSDFNLIFEACRETHKKLTFDEVYANHILSLGFAVEGHTVLNEIKKVQPGREIIFNGEDHIENYYFRFDFNYVSTDAQVAIDQLDVLFRKAVHRCFQKDLEYGYESHLADMSGGLDSRMTSWVAHELGYVDVTNISYGKADSLDEEYGRKVSQALGNAYIFESLDDVEFIYDIEELVHMNFGLATYVGITGGKKILSEQDFTKFGLEHTGQLGGAIVGSFCVSASDTDPHDMRSLQYSDRITPVVHDVDEYENKEAFAMYYRGLQGTLMTHHIRRNYTEAVAPFLDVDFMQYCLHLPLELRCGHKLYFEWIKAKYPAALGIPNTRRPETKGIDKKKLYHKMPTWMRHMAISVSNKLHLTALISDKRGMNPMDYWYGTNEKMRSFIQHYYEEHIVEMREYPEIVNELKNVYTNGRTMDKLLVLTVIAAFHLYASEG